MDRTWPRRAALACVLAVLTTACGSAATASPSSTATAPPWPTATPTPSPSPVPATPSPTASPTEVPTGYEPQPDGTIYWYTEAGDRETVPTIDGLKAQVQGNRILYEAEAGNRFGLKEGAYSGEFNKYVKVENKQTGGAVLEPQVVYIFVKDKLATIPNQSDKWVASIPLNITDATADTGINLSFGSGYGDNQIKIASVSFNGPLEVTDIFPVSDGKNLATGNSIYYGHFYYSQFKLNSEKAEIPLGKEMSFFSVDGNFEGITPTMEASFGNKVCTATGSITIAELAKSDWREMTPDRILYTPDANVPVFVAHNARPNADLAILHFPATDTLAAADMAPGALRRAA
jgi:hypothetical protein